MSRIDAEKPIVVYAGNIPKNLDSELSGVVEGGVQVLFLRDIRAKKELSPDIKADYVVRVDFFKPDKIVDILKPFQHRLIAITTHGDIGVNRLKNVIPHVPYLQTPTRESLVWATNKYEMRKRFALHSKEITPAFTRVKENSKSERTRVMKKIGFPMIIKPADLASSLLVSVCYHEEELQQVLRKTFRSIKKMYTENKRTQEPLVLAEAFMDGDMYSIDSYVESRGEIDHCPLVKVVRGTDIGRDDFFNYIHMTPSGLKSETEEKAELVAAKAIRALGLRSTTAHTELIKSDKEWRVIEIGARMGGFRHVIHSLSSGINHIANDILVRLPKKPVIPREVKRHAAAVKWFAKEEGVIVAMKGIKKIESLESFHQITVNQVVGERAKFSKNGGKSVFHVFLCNKRRSHLLADIRRIEKCVEIKVK